MINKVRIAALCTATVLGLSSISIASAEVPVSISDQPIQLAFWGSDKVETVNPIRTEDVDGVTILVVKEGDKIHYPGEKDNVIVAYKGMTLSGKVFDQSSKSQFNLTGVIAGWSLALQKMSVGETSRLIIPPVKAYGEKGVPGVIPPNATLMFDVTLRGIIPATSGQS